MRILASDFDNTLFIHKGNNGYFRKEDIQAIKEFQERGNLFGLCTGRGLFDVRFDAKGIIDFDFYILMSGAVIMDKNCHILHAKPIPFCVIRDMYLNFKDRYPHNPLFVTKDRFCCIQEKIFDVETSIYPSIEALSALEFFGVSYVLQSPAEAQKFCSELNVRYADDMIGYHNNTDVDIVRQGNSKGTGIQFIKDYLNAGQICGIGDSFNDLPMLEASDISFTFHTSPEPVKKQADYLVNNIAEAIRILR